MKEYDNNNRFSLWLNEKRDKATSAHLNGSGQVEVEYWANAWFSKDLTEDDKLAIQKILQRHAMTTKRPFITISITPKVALAKPESASLDLAPAEFQDDESIPF